MKRIEFNYGSYNNDAFFQLGILPNLTLVRWKSESIYYYILVLDWLCWNVELKINIR